MLDTRIPLDLIDSWTQFRMSRARLRQAHLRLTQSFWKVIPRRKHRVMPVVTFTKVPTRWEPEPIQGLIHSDGKTFIDNLGLTLRWRVSGLKIDGTAATRKAVPIWMFDLPLEKLPPIGLMLMGEITEEEDMANYRHYWQVITKVHQTYVQVGENFEMMVQQREAWSVGMQGVEEYVGREEDTMAADGSQDQALGTARRAS